MTYCTVEFDKLTVRIFFVTFFAIYIFIVCMI